MRSESLYKFGFSAFKRTGVYVLGVFRGLEPFRPLEEERRHLASMLAHDLKTPVIATLALLNRLRL